MNSHTPADGTEDIISIVNGIFYESVTRNASDIHIEPKAHAVDIRFRIDGNFVHYKTLSEETLLPIVTRMKMVANLKIDENRVPQDGKASLSLNNQDIDLRVSVLPILYGEKVVIRLLKSSNEAPNLEKMGMLDYAMNKVKKCLKKTYGIILVAGPTGAGKTTTLYGMLGTFDPTKYNISTLEDPVEYKMKDVNQSQMRPDVGFSFIDGLRSIVRQDPDIIMVGEIRDRETASLAIESALTGHLVFSTIHTNSASATVQRLLNMGIEKYLVPTAVQLVVSQRLVRRICPSCEETYRPSNELIDTIEKEVGHIITINKENIHLSRGKGCEKCTGSGFFGRVAVFEVMPMSQKLTEVIMTPSVTAQEIEKIAVEEGMLTLRQDGILKAVMNMTTVEEALAISNI